MALQSLASAPPLMLVPTEEIPGCLIVRSSAIEDLQLGASSLVLRDPDLVLAGCRNSAFHNARPLDRETRPGGLLRVAKLSPFIVD